MTRHVLVRTAATAVAVVGLAAGLLGLVRAGEAGGDRSIVLLSGRDDHGIAVRDTVPLHDAPDGEVVAEVPADALAEVHGQRPPWLRVTVLEGSPVTGWVDDFLVRGDLHMVDPDAPACAVTTDVGVLPPSARVRVVDIHESGMVGVHAAAGGPEHHVPRGLVRELPGPRPPEDGDCTTVADTEAPAHDH